MDLLKDIQNRKDVPDDIKKKVTQFIIKCRKREKELLQANTIISRSPVVAFLWKNEVGWPVEYVSDNVERLFGYTVEEFLSGEVMYIQIIHTEDIERVIAEVEDNSREGGLQSFTHKPYRIKIKYGEAKWIEDTTFIRRDCHGAISHYEGIIQDITERKQAEESFLQLQKLESLGEMAGGIAHDFNNLLAGIMGNTSIALLDGKNSIEQKKLLEKVIIASKRATNLTQQLLTFAKGGIPAMKVTSIAEIIEESVSLVLGQSSQVKCELNLPKDLWLSEINTSQIGQVFQNLIINAEQSMPEGGTMEIQAGNVELKANNPFLLKPGDFVHVAVKDSGIGIPKKYLHKIFDPYFSTKDSRKNKGGSGLGLAVAYSVIQKHNGHIFANSKAGEGSIFHIYLPADRHAVIRKGFVEEAEITESLKILVMDDDPIIRKMVRTMLERLGYRVILSEDGEEAIKKYVTARDFGEPFDLVILDLTIPGGMGGEETLTHLRKIDPEVRTIISSGYGDQIPGEFSGVLPKPYRMEDLRRVIREMMAE